MKIIKSLLLVSVGLSATLLLHAQELKTEVLKQHEIKAPPASTESNKPSPLPQLKPMDGVVPKEAPVAAQTPSPLKKDENKIQPENLKAIAISKDANGPANKLTPEQLKTLNGTAERPKQTMPAATLDAQNAKPIIIIAPSPAVVKE
jgi:hypothetical protein